MLAVAAFLLSGGTGDSGNFPFGFSVYRTTISQHTAAAAVAGFLYLQIPSY
jgi:hypothetical protein